MDDLALWTGKVILVAVLAMVFGADAGMTDPTHDSATDPLVVYLMRGLPSCGKTHTACVLAGETGIVCETDEFFYTQVGDDRNRFDYDADRWKETRQWNYDRFVNAINSGLHPIVVDRGNGLNLETQQYAAYADRSGYRVELAEPTSEWWQEIRVLLKYKEATTEILDAWALQLAKRNLATHRTPVATIRRWMDKWRHDVTVDDILNFPAGERSGRAVVHRTPSACR